MGVGPLLPASGGPLQVLHSPGLAQAHRYRPRWERGQDVPPLRHVYWFRPLHTLSLAVAVAAAGCCLPGMWLVPVLPGHLGPLVGASEGERASSPTGSVPEHSPREALTPSRRGTFFLSSLPALSSQIAWGLACCLSKQDLSSFLVFHVASCFHRHKYGVMAH